MQSLTHSASGSAALTKLPTAAALMVKATSAAIERQFFTLPDGFLSLMGRLTAFVSINTMALVEDAEVFGSRQLDTGNSGQVCSTRYKTLFWLLLKFLGVWLTIPALPSYKSLPAYICLLVVAGSSTTLYQVTGHISTDAVNDALIAARRLAPTRWAANYPLLDGAGLCPMKNTA